MIYLCFIWHMHQPYYIDLKEGKILLPWVRLQGIKNYLHILKILKRFPQIHQTFNLTPSLLEQISFYKENYQKDIFFSLSLKEPSYLKEEELNFILKNFFKINFKYVIFSQPRYCQLYYKRENKEKFSSQDILDLQVLFNLGWFGHYFKKNIPFLKELLLKQRFYSEQEKKLLLKIQLKILSEIIPTYKEMKNTSQIEIITSPYFHPILPLIFNSNIALKSNPHLNLLEKVFSYPEDVSLQLKKAKSIYKKIFKDSPKGLWPSEQAISKETLNSIAEENFEWTISDEEILFKSLKSKKKISLYKAYFFKLNQDKGLNIIFRDRYLSDAIGFKYQYISPQEAVNDFIKYIEKIKKASSGNFLVAVALDGENPWQYYRNDGWDFLSLLYERILNTPYIKTLTVNEYLKKISSKIQLESIFPGSWINADFSKWIGNPIKNLAWKYLSEARQYLKDISKDHKNYQLLLKQIFILEGSDWFWWFGEKEEDFDYLFRRHLKNFYNFLEKKAPSYLNRPLRVSILT